MMNNVRMFSMPNHIKLTMPNLSPTMEKVQFIIILTNFCIGKYIEVVQERRGPYQAR